MIPNFQTTQGSSAVASQLEAARLLRIDDVTKAVGLSRAHIYALMAEGKFPQPIRMGKRCSRWPTAAVLAFIGAQQ